MAEIAPGNMAMIDPLPAILDLSAAVADAERRGCLTLQMSTAEVLAELRSKCGVTVKRLLSVEQVRYGE